MDNATKRVYLDLLIAALRVAEEELEIMETYLTEDNFDQYFYDYVNMNNHISSLQRELDKTAKELGMKRKQIRSLILT